MYHAFFIWMQENADLDMEFTSHMMEPRLVVFCDEEEIKQMFICAENEAIVEIPTLQLADGFTHLMAAYYVFNVEYPSSCKATLLFFQEILMGKREKVARRPVRYSNFVDSKMQF